MIIKVCGLNNAQNLLEIIQLPIDWVGYNFYKPSSRFLTEVSEVYNTTIQKRVGVFVNATVDEIRMYKEIYNLDFAQLHGDEDAKFCQEISAFIDIIKVFRIDNTFDFGVLANFEMSKYFLFDTASPSFGGTGKAFDWNLLQNIEITKPFLLSGGIGPDDIEKIHAFQHPYFIGVDINSRFEDAPGIKNHEKIAAFITQINTTNQTHKS